MSATTNTRARLSSDAALWASAIVLGAILIVQAGRNADNPASADMVTGAGGYVVMTTQGQNEELLFMIDNFNEDLYVYSVAQQRSLELLRKEHLPDVFRSARAASGR